MRPVLSLTGLILSLVMGGSFAQTAATHGKNEAPQAMAAPASVRQCAWEGKRYSLGAVVTKKGRSYRCGEVHIEELNNPPAVAWVELSAALAPMK